MARDFGQLIKKVRGQGSAPHRDFRALIDSVRTNASPVAAPVDTTLSTMALQPEPEEAMQRTEDKMRAVGFPEPVIADTTRPYGIGSTITPGNNFAGPRLMRVRPEVAAKAPANEESLKITAQIPGASTSTFESIRALFDPIPNALNHGTAEARSWWQKMRTSVSDKVATTVSTGIMDFNLGLALLDAASFVNKKVKLGLMPAAERAKLEAVALPKITLHDLAGNEKKFSSGTSAAIWVMQQRLYGTVESVFGAVKGRKDIQLHGAQRVAHGFGQIPNLVASLGQNIEWDDVVERTVGPDDYEHYIAERNSVELAGLAAGNALAELVLDPQAIALGAVGKVPSLLRAGVAATMTAKAAQVTSEVARTTHRAEDALEAVALAERHLAKVEAAANGAKTASGGLPMEHARRLVLARQQLADERQWLDQFRDAGANLPIMLRSVRRSPEFIPELRTTEAYVASSVPRVPEQLELPLTNVDLAPGSIKLREVPRPVHEIADELHLYRHAELERDADKVVHWDQVDDLPLFQQRQILGPDDAEQAGDALNHMARTGGVGVDDVAITPQAPEYAAHPESQVGLIDWRAIDAANQATRTERQLIATSGARQYELGLSAQRTLARQEDILKRSLGAARRYGDKPAIKRFETELKSLRGTRGALGKAGRLELDDFDESWLPPASKGGILRDPERHNNWLQAAGDRVTRSLYPGGMAVNALWDTRAGQVFAPLREPGRFYETYDPIMWDRVRSGYLRFQQNTRAWYDEMLAGAEDAGIMTKRSKWNPKKEFSPYTIDHAKDEQLFDLLDTPRESPAFKELADAADPKILAFHDKIRARLNELAEQQAISSTDLYLSGYIRHTFDHSQFAGGARPIEYIGLPGNARVFASHLIERTGTKTERSAMLALDYSGRAANRKLVLEPLFEDIIANGGELAAKHKNPAFQTYANDLVNVLKGKPTFLGKRIDDHLGGAINKNGGTRWQPGTIDRALTGIVGMVWAGALAGNPRYPVMQIATGVSTTASRFGLWRTMKGIWQMGLPEGQAINKAAGTYDTFTDIFESDFMRKFSKVMADRGYTIGPFGVMSTGTTEFFIRGVTNAAAIDMYLTKHGFSSFREALDAGWGKRILFESLRATEEVNHMYGALGRSPTPSRILGRGITVSATQFLSFIPKQTEELVAQFNRDPGKLAMYMAMSGWVSRLAAEQLGINVTNYVGLGYIPTTPDDFSSPAADTMMKFYTLAHDMSTRNPADVADSARQFMNSAESLIPFIAAFNTAGKSAQRLETGTQIDLGGNKLRDLAMGDFTLMPGQMTGEELGRSLRPEGVEAPGLGGDVLPTVFGQQAIREELFRQGQAAIRRENERFFFNLERTVRQFIDAAEKGDQDKLSELSGELQNVYNIRLTSPSSLDRAAQARSLSWLFRQIRENPSKIDLFIEIGRQFGMEVMP